MPSVPLYDRPQVAPNVRRAPQVSPAATGAGAAAMGLSVAADLLAKERERAGRIRANAAEADIRNVSQRINEQVQQMQRTQAFGAEDFVQEQWDANVSKVIAGLSDPLVREQVELRANVLRDELTARARQHATRQREVVEAESYERNQTDDLGKLRDTPLPDAEAIVERLALRAEERARTQGMDDEAVAAERRNVQSKARLMQVNALISGDRPDAAVEFLRRQEVRDQMTPDDLMRAEKLAEAETIVLRTQQARDQLVAQYKTEAEALAAAREQYSGELEERVRQSVREYFGEQEQAKRQAVQTATDNALRGIMAGTGIPDADRRFLTENDPKALDELNRYRVARARGEEPETDWNTYEELLDIAVNDPATFRDLNLSQYRNQLSDRHYEEFVEFKVGQRGRRERLSPLAVNQFIWGEARRTGIVMPTARTPNDLKGRKEEMQRFTQLESAIKDALTSALEANPRLTLQEQRAVMQRVVDEQVIVETGMFGTGRDTLPAAAVLPNQTVVGQVARPEDLTAPLSPAALTRAQALKAQGQTPDQIAATLRREGLLTPTP